MCGPDNVPRFVPSAGPRTAKLIVVGEAPGADEVENSKEPFTGKTGKYIYNQLYEQGIVFSRDVYRTNSVLCRPPLKGGANQAPKPRDIDACNERLMAELATCTQKHVILVFGRSAVRAIRPDLDATISSLQGHVEWSDDYNAWLVYSYHPAAIFRTPEYAKDVNRCIAKAVELLEVPKPEDGSIDSQYEIKVARSSAEVIIELEFMRAGPTEVMGVDIETDDIGFLTSPILEVGISSRDNYTFIIPHNLWEEDEWAHKCLQSFFEDPHLKFVWHNGKFDTQFIQQQLKINARVDADTMLMHYALDERSAVSSTDTDGSTTQVGNYGGAHDLKTLGRIYCNAPLWGDEAHEQFRKVKKMSLVDDNVRHKYHGLDCIFTRKLYFELAKLLYEEPAPRDPTYHDPEWLHEHVLVPAQAALSKVEMRGVLVDVRRLDQLADEWSEKIADLYAEIQNDVRRLTKNKIYALFNPDSAVQVIRFIHDDQGLPEDPKGRHARAAKRQHKEYARTANSTHLEDLKEYGTPEQNLFLQHMQDYREVKHQYKVYLEGLRDKLDANNCAHTDYRLHGTVTGRLASRNPALQVIPRDSAIKELFIPREGHTFLAADYEQLEVRVAAYFSREPQLVEDFKSDDFHWAAAHNYFPALVRSVEDAYKVDDYNGLVAILDNVILRETKNIYKQLCAANKRPNLKELFGLIKRRIRFQSKFVTFGRIYGRGADSLTDMYNGLGLSEHDAKAFLDNQKAMYPVLQDYLDTQIEEMQHIGWLETPTGRRRRFVDMPERWKYTSQAMNFQIQSFASDICLSALTYLVDELPKRGLGYVLMTVHDCICCEVPTDRLAEASEFIQYVMENPPLEDRNIKFSVELNVGPNWRACH